MIPVENWGIDGVTTNPKHLILSGKPFKTVISELAEQYTGVDFPISVEIDPHLEKSEDMISAAREFAGISDNFVIKIPCTEQGLVAVRKLKAENIRTNCTLVFSPSQAVQAARSGAYFVSPFVGWKEASGEDTTDFMTTLVEIYRNYAFESQIIVAAVRNGKQLADAAFLGADICTAGFEVYRDSFYHPFTDYGLKRFQEAWDETDLG